MTVDVDNLTATVSPSTRGGQEFAPFLGQHGLVFPGGHCSTVGLGGYLLQGGQGGCTRAGPRFFGIVTRFHLRVYRMPVAFTHTTYAFPIDCFDELIHWAHDALPTLDSRVVLARLRLD